MGSDFFHFNNLNLKTFIIIFILTIVIGCLFGMTILNIIDKRLSNICVNLPEQNITLKVPQNNNDTHVFNIKNNDEFELFTDNNNDKNSKNNNNKNILIREINSTNPNNLQDHSIIPNNQNNSMYNNFIIQNKKGLSQNNKDKLDKISDPSIKVNNDNVRASTVTNNESNTLFKDDTYFQNLYKNKDNSKSITDYTGLPGYNLESYNL
jgi:hypothetical protein